MQKDTHKSAEKDSTITADDSLDTLLDARANIPSPLEIQMKMAQEIRLG